MKKFLIFLSLTVFLSIFAGIAYLVIEYKRKKKLIKFDDKKLGIVNNDIAKSKRVYDLEWEKDFSPEMFPLKYNTELSIVGEIDDIYIYEMLIDVNNIIKSDPPKQYFAVKKEFVTIKK